MLVKECGFQSYQQKYCIMFQMNLIRFIKMFPFMFLYKTLNGLAQVNWNWPSFKAGYDCDIFVILVLLGNIERHIATILLCRLIAFQT